MSYTISELSTDLESVMHGTSTDEIQNLYALFDRAAKNLIQRIDPVETIRVSNFGLVYRDIYDYSLPADFKKMVDLRPQVDRQLSENFTRRFTETFDLYKSQSGGRNTFQIKNDDGTRSVRISTDAPKGPITLHNLDGITGNGTWAVGDDGTNLTQDTSTRAQGGASLNFDVSGATTTAYIENSTFADVDLTDHDEKSDLFVWVYLPSASAITNVILRWGNDTSNYWSVTSTTQANGDSFRDGWNQVKFSWNGATETGTVAPSTVDYARVTFTYDGTADTDFRVDAITSALGEQMEIVYYSKYLFTAADGTTWKEKVTADTDTINLDTDSYNIFLFEVAILASQQIEGQDSLVDIRFFQDELYGDGRKVGLYKQYKKDNPGEGIKPQGQYYRFNRNAINPLDA